MGNNSTFTNDANFGYSPLGSSADMPYRSDYRGFTNYEQELARSIFAQLEKVADIEFQEQTDSTSVDIRMGVTGFGGQFAASAYLPYAQAAYNSHFAGQALDSMALAGDIWINSSWLNDVKDDDDFISVLAHEIGHSLGLIHTFENGEPGTPFSTSQNLEASLDYGRYSIMSYEQWPTSISQSKLTYWTSALTMMPLDIDALQYLYGESTNTDDDVYVFLSEYEYDITDVKLAYAQSRGAEYNEYPSGYVSIVDSGGYNELFIEFSTNLTVNLNPGSWINTGGGYSTSGYSDPNLFLDLSTKIHALTTGRGSDTITGNDFGNTINSGSGQDYVILGAGDDIVNLGSGNDQLVASAGVDTVDGGSGTDTIHFENNSSDAFQFIYDDQGALRIENVVNGDTINLSNIENLSFTDRTLSSVKIHDQLQSIGESLLRDKNIAAYTSALISQAGGEIVADDAQLYRIYYAGLGRAPDQEGFDWWQLQINNEVYSLNELAARFIDSPEFLGLADTNNSGSISNSEFLEHMYTNVFGRPLDVSGYGWWLEQLDFGSYSMDSAFNGMVQSDEFVLLSASTVSAQFFIV